MGTDVDGFLHDLARGLEPRADELVDALWKILRAELPQLWEYEDIAVLAPTALSGRVSLVLDFLQGRLGPAEVTTPAVSIEFACRLARHGVVISDLLRVYRLVHAGLFHLLYQEVVRVARDPELINAAVIKLSGDLFKYTDKLAAQGVAVYQAERDRWLQRRLIVINEASTRIGTTLDTVRTAEQLTEVGIDHFADLVTVDLLDSVFSEEKVHPANGPPALRRIAQSASEAGPDLTGDTARTYPEGSAPATVLTTGQPLRVSVTSSGVPIWLSGTAGPGKYLSALGIHSILLVPLSARGHSLGLAQFFRGRTADPFDDDDLLLAQEIVSRAAVYIDNARRYSRERFTALTLQRSLLPRHAPSAPAVETAARYLPSGSRAGVGGDWYDVIALSGARVALVVGDVVGRGLHAAATMGRLRTAVRTLADIDLAPDELLTHLDDVVIRLQREEAGGADEIAATCLYAVYDPVSRTCSLASAGHVLPAVVAPLAANSAAPPSRAVDFPELPVGPPLGLGGLPFETAQFMLEPGSLLVLYTDGLIESHARHLDAGLARLREGLTHAPESLGQTCDGLLSALLPSHPADDIALLVARTKALDADHVATMDLASDPAVVSDARAHASSQLAAWGLEDLGFTTELVVSELVTNAIRYGSGPIQLRMIFESTLTCEVSDASSTAPHLRRARVFDEGGRGLLLVAQLTERWGTRYSREGKVIWAEQLIPDSGPSRTVHDVI